jgi:hypothetical protein
MIPRLRQNFNAHFTPEKYRILLQGLDQRCGTHVKFRVCETPCFFPKSLLEKMASYGKGLTEQLLNDPNYQAVSKESIPFEFDVPRETSHPVFIQVDFGLVRDPAGNLQPKLVEIQGFPSLYAYQPTMAQLYMEVFGLDPTLGFLFDGLNLDAYRRLLCRAILGDQHPENVILLEIDPLEQKTLPDFILTERLCRIKTVCITEILKEGNRLFYYNKGRRIPVYRVYNRAIADELARKGKRLPFSFRDDLDVEWAGHPNWFFRISKFSIPYLRHGCVPRTYFLNASDPVPDDLENYVLKPLYSYAGCGVIIQPTEEDLRAIPESQRSKYILQERIEFEPVVETPYGATKAEVRIMYLWLEELRPVTTIVRMGRGKMMGVDHNRDMEWVGASAAFYPDD